VNSEMAERILPVFRAELPLDPDRDTRAREAVQSGLARLQAALPDPIAWDVARVDDVVELRLLTPQCLVTVSVDLDELAAYKPQPSVRSRGLDPASTSVTLSFGAPTRDEDGHDGTVTRWSFSDLMGAFEVSGFVTDAGEPDRSEVLARRIAGQIGW